MTALALTTSYKREKILNSLRKRITDLEDYKNIKAPILNIFSFFYRKVKWSPSKPKLEDIKYLLEKAIEFYNNDTSGSGTYFSGYLLDSAIEEFSKNLKQIEKNFVIYRFEDNKNIKWIKKLFNIIEKISSYFSSNNNSHIGILASKNHLYLENDLFDNKKIQKIIKNNKTFEIKLKNIDLLINKYFKEINLSRREKLIKLAENLIEECTSENEDIEKILESRSLIIKTEIQKTENYKIEGQENFENIFWGAKKSLERENFPELEVYLDLLKQYTANNDHDSSFIELNNKTNSFLTEQDNSNIFKKVFGEYVFNLIEEGYAKARINKHNNCHYSFSDYVYDYFNSNIEEVFNCVLSSESVFNIGNPLTPAIIETFEYIPKTVKFPTSIRKSVIARDLSNLKNIEIQHPQTIIYDLADGSLREKKFISKVKVTKSKQVLQGEIRIYVMDISPSMIMTPQRWRAREAIILSEILKIKKLFDNEKDNIHRIMFYSFFSEIISNVKEIKSSEDALRAIEEI